MDDSERFLSLAQRELSADHVRMLAPGEVPPEATNAVVVRLKDGRHVVATFATTPKDFEVLSRRLSVLANTFADAVAPRYSALSVKSRPPRPPMVSALHEELKALGVRVIAHDVVVIDGDSPVVWGCASSAGRPRTRHEMLLRDVSDRELSAKDEPSTPAIVYGLHAVPAADDSGPLQRSTAPTGVLRMAPRPADSEPADSEPANFDSADSELAHLVPALGSFAHQDEHGQAHEHDQDAEPEITRRAIADIRKLPSLDLLHKGKHLRHVARGESSYLVLSFSSIYLLCMVFDGDFDELRAERAAHEALPRIERLVLALPPLDPDPQPTGGVVALRRPRRR